MRYSLLVLMCVTTVLVAACDAPPGEGTAGSVGADWPLSEVAEPNGGAEEVAGVGEPTASVAGSESVGSDVTADTTSTSETGEGETSVVEEAPLYPAPVPGEDFPDARFPRPEHVRGLYVNAWAAGSSKRMGELIEMVTRTEINSVVIDIKDVTGYVSHRTNVPLARTIGATEQPRIRDLAGLLARLEEAGIYPIARIVVVKDSVLSHARPDYAVQDTAGGVWIDSKGIIWMNPFSRDLWEYNVSLAREVAEMGFPEIQWDYIRFPDAPVSDMERAVFTGSDGRERVEAIRGFLTYAREELSDLPVRSTADVFGVTTSFRRDIGLGQLWEGFIDVVDVALPMVYPSHYWEGSFGYGKPNAYPYEVVRAALRDAQSRSRRVEGAGMTRPWLQDFTLGQPFYGAPEVRAQIQGAYDAGVQEWVLWNPSTRYSEGALEPASGWEVEPMMRVAGVIAPVSRRHVVMDSVAALPRPVDTASTAGDTIPAMDQGSTAAVDTVTAADTVAVPDTLGVR